MKESLKTVCETMIRNRDLLKKQFRWESDYLYPVCANIFLTEGASPDSERLADCNRMIKESVGIFSNFRGNVRLPLICSLACDQDPQARWERAQGFYQIFKEHFFRSEFLALGAAMLAGSSKIDAETLASRARILYKRMKKEHPLLTGWEDSVSALLLAQSTRDDDMLIEDVEQCYQLLRERMPISDGLQTSAHVLAMSEEAPEQKCARMLEIYDAVSSRCKKYGRSYELPMIAVLSFLDLPVETLAEEVAEAVEEIREAAAETEMPDPAEEIAEIVESVLEPEESVTLEESGEEDCGGPDPAGAKDALRAALLTFRPVLKKMSAKDRRKACADIAAQLRRTRRAGDGRIYSALASARKPAAAVNLADLGKRIMASRNANYSR